MKPWHIGGAHPHVADAGMKCGEVAEKHQGLLATVLELGAAVDVAQQQTNDVVALVISERVWLGAGNAITDPVGVPASLELLKAPN